MRGQKQSDRPTTIHGTGYELVLFSASGFVTSNKRACFYVLFDGDINLSDPTVRDRGSLFNDIHNRGEILYGSNSRYCPTDNARYTGYYKLPWNWMLQRSDVQ